MGMDRGAVQSNGYRSYQHRYGRDSNYGGYNSNKFGHGMHYDSKYDNSSKQSEVTGASTTVANGYQNGTAAKGQASNTSTNDQSPSSSSQPEEVTVASLEKKLSTFQEEMNKALEESSQKEKKKFDLIFSILTELQTRQTQLDQSLKMLKDHVTNGGCGPQIGVSLASDSNSQAQQINGGMTGPMGGQVVMMAPNGMGMVGGQVGMNQFGNGMMMMDGSGNVMAPVIMAMPQNGGAGMQFMNTGMMPQGVNMAVPNQMMQFVVNQAGEGNGDCQWNQDMMMVNGSNDGSNGSTATGNLDGDDTARSTGDQQSENSTQETPEKAKMDLMTHEEE